MGIRDFSSSPRRNYVVYIYSFDDCVTALLNPGKLSVRWLLVWERWIGRFFKPSTNIVRALHIANFLSERKSLMNSPHRSSDNLSSLDTCHLVQIKLEGVMGVRKRKGTVNLPQNGVKRFPIIFCQSIRDKTGIEFFNEFISVICLHIIHVGGKDKMSIYIGSSGSFKFHYWNVDDSLFSWVAWESHTISLGVCQWLH